jgi:hypothetical protein
MYQTLCTPLWKRKTPVRPKKVGTASEVNKSDRNLGEISTDGSLMLESDRIWLSENNASHYFNLLLILWY